MNEPALICCRQVAPLAARDYLLAGRRRNAAGTPPVNRAPGETDNAFDADNSNAAIISRQSVVASREPRAARGCAARTVSQVSLRSLYLSCAAAAGRTQVIAISHMRH